MYNRKDKAIAFLMILPSLILLAIFVYYFIGQTAWYSVSDWGIDPATALKKGVEKNYVGLDNYHTLISSASDYEFRLAFISTFYFTIFFLGSCLILGFFLAFLLDQRIKGEGIFRTIFLFPMSLSFVVTGTIWNWLLKPKGGLNILPNKLFGADPLEYKWLNSDTTMFKFEWLKGGTLFYLGIALFTFALFTYVAQKRNLSGFWVIVAGLVLWLISAAGFWDKIWLPIDNPVRDIGTYQGYGYNAALSGIVIAATWQMAGYVMALFLAGIRGISEELREAARVDGCAEWQVYVHIILPQLRPIALSAIIILGHISLKIFDLVYAMTGIDNRYVKVPGILMLKGFRSNEWARSSAVAMVMLFAISLVIIPYLWSNLRTEKQS